MFLYSVSIVIGHMIVDSFSKGFHDSHNSISKGFHDFFLFYISLGLSSVSRCSLHATTFHARRSQSRGLSHDKGLQWKTLWKAVRFSVLLWSSSIAKMAFMFI